METRKREGAEYGAGGPRSSIEPHAASPTTLSHLDGAASRLSLADGLAQTPRGEHVGAGVSYDASVIRHDVQHIELGENGLQAAEASRRRRGSHTTAKQRPRSSQGPGSAATLGAAPRKSSSRPSSAGAASQDPLWSSGHRGLDGSHGHHPSPTGLGHVQHHERSLRSSDSPRMPLSGSAPRKSHADLTSRPSPTADRAETASHRIATTVSVEELIAILERDTDHHRPHLIVDVRPVDEYSHRHLKDSVNANFPSLLMKRFRKGTTSTFSLASFLTTDASKQRFEQVSRDSSGSTLHLEQLDVYIVDHSIEERHAGRSPPMQSTGDVLLSVLERLPSRSEPKGQLRYLRSFQALEGHPRAREWLVSEVEEAGGMSGLIDLPASSSSVPAPLSTPVGTGPPGRTTSPVFKPSPQRLKGALRITTSPTMPSGSVRNSSAISSTASPSVGRRPGLQLETGENLRAVTSTRSPSPLGLMTHSGPSTSVPPKTALGPAFTLGHAAKQISDEDVELGTANDTDVTFTVSEIIPNVLYLGPEPVTEEDVRTLEGLGIQRILNMALEVDERPDLKMKNRFQRVEKLAMRDFVEEQNVQSRIDEACAFLDDANLHSKAAYVHCRAGKSRSVMIVLAFLIHRFRWPLKRAYSHIQERRPSASPNLGFMAELLRYEERELGSSKASSLSASGPAPHQPLHSFSLTPDPSSAGQLRLPSSQGSRMRDSLPPASNWKEGGERESEQEVKSSGGTWVYHHRRPVDAALLPLRRASKAGLEGSG